MIYTKNVPNWERALRIVVSMVAAAFVYKSGYGLVATFAVASFSLTGFFGFCPMCAMVGRKLDKQRESVSKTI